MSPEKVLVALLKADAAVVAAVADRIYPAGAMQAATFPALFFHVVSDVPQPPLSASVGENVSVARVQLSCQAESYTDASALCALAQAACHLKYGVVAGVKVVSCLLALRGPDYYDEQQCVFINSLDFSITYQE